MFDYRVCVCFCLTSLPCMLPTYLNSGMPTRCSLGCWPSISTQSSLPAKQNKCPSSSSKIPQWMDRMAEDKISVSLFSISSKRQVNFIFFQWGLDKHQPSVTSIHTFILSLTLSASSFSSPFCMSCHSTHSYSHSESEHVRNPQDELRTGSLFINSLLSSPPTQIQNVYQMFQSTNNEFNNMKFCMLGSLSNRHNHQDGVNTLDILRWSL